MHSCDMTFDRIGFVSCFFLLLLLVFLLCPSLIKCFRFFDILFEMLFDFLSRPTTTTTSPLAAEGVIFASTSRWIQALQAMDTSPVPSSPFSLGSASASAVASASSQSPLVPPLSDEKADVPASGLPLEGAGGVVSTRKQSPRLVRTRTFAASYPCNPRSLPQFITLPHSYTKLHGMLTAVCDYDYPALCMTCGSIIDAGGNGLCTKHNKDCASGVGVYFLLQDCMILLLDGMRGTYYPAPYVDAHGEKHRSFRGKPLFIDAKRCVLLLMSTLTSSHGSTSHAARTIPCACTPFYVITIGAVCSQFVFFICAGDISYDMM